MKIRSQKLKRIAYVAAAFALAFAGVFQGLLASRANALMTTATQVQSRSIIMSDSRVSQTGVDYQVTFTTQQAYTLEGVVLEFCDSASVPIIDDADCADPPGFSVGGATPAFDFETGVNNLDPNANWTSEGVAPTSAFRVAKFRNSTGIALTSSTAYTFTLTNVTNQSATGTFYARLILYTQSTGDIDAYDSDTSGTTEAIEFGGFALSTANSISITARVAEALTFCVSLANPGANCSGTSPPAVTLGEAPNNTLLSTAVSNSSAAPIYTQMSTNASGGAIVRMKNTAASGGLNALFGSGVIPPTGDAPAAIAAGTAAFGVRVAATGTGTGDTIDVDTNYDHATNYGMDAVTTGADATSVLTTYGDPVFSCDDPLSEQETTFIFAATASNTTPAGTYAATIILVASGTF